MTATLTYAETARSLEYVYVFLIEGVEVAITSHSDPAAIKSLWTATEHGAMTADWLGGLIPEGSITSKIKLFDPKVETDSITIKVVDQLDWLAGMTQSEALSSAARTTLREALDADDTTVRANRTTDFAASGAIYIGHERITYASKTGGGTPTFDTCTRGTLALFQRDAGGDFAYSHGSGTSIADGGQLVEISDQPRVWLNRRCALYVLHREGSTWQSGSAPLCLWAGRIKSIEDDGGVVSFAVTGIAECLDTLVFSNQFQAEMAPGASFAYQATVRISGGFEIAGVSDDETYYDDFIEAGRWTHQQIASAVAHQMSLAEATAGFYGTNWHLALTDLPNVEGQRYVFSVEPDTSSDSYHFWVALPKLAWAMLGFTTDAADGLLEISTYTILLERRNFTRDADGDYTLAADGPPLLQYETVGLGQPLALADDDDSSITGEWVTQANIPAGSIGIAGYSPSGYMMIDGQYLVGVSESGGAFTVAHAGLGKIENIANGISKFGAAIAIPDTTGGRPIRIKQVWLEYGDVADLLLRLLLSTGTSGGYNHADYDDFDADGFGVGLPASLIDEDTWKNLQGSGYWLVLDKPQRYSELLESALEVRGGYCVWRRGKLAIVFPGEPTSGDGTYDLTEANKADTKTTRYRRSSDAIINVCKLRWNRTIDGKWLDEATVKAASSISDLGERKPVTLEATGVYEGLLGSEGGGLDEAWDTIAQALGYFSRPIAEVTRSYAHPLMGMAAGDTVNLTDERVIDPTTGVRGVSGWPCWVSETKWDLAQGAGECTLVFLPEFDKDQRAKWAPSAEVSSSSVSSSRLIVTCTAHKYTPSTDTLTDSDHLATAGNKVLVAEVSPTNPASPTTYALEVLDSPGANQIRFTTDPTATVGLATSKKWVVQFDDYATSTTTQKGGYSYVAANLTRLILSGGSDFYRIWQGWVPFATQAVDYTTLYRKIVDQADNDGEGHSVHWFVDGANSTNTIWSVKRQVLFRGDFDTDRTATTEAFIAGPCRVPLYGFNRTLNFRARAACSGGGTATVKVVLSSGPPSGSSATSFTFPDGAINFGTVTTTSASQAWTSEGTLTNPGRLKHGRLDECWVTVLASSSAGTATVTDVEVYEKALT